jgi:hypothetical protein
MTTERGMTRPDLAALRRNADVDPTTLALACGAEVKDSEPRSITFSAQAWAAFCEAEDALRAQPVAWQPIESAPRTGLCFLAASTASSVFLAHWANGVVDSSSWNEDAGYQERYATHWQPLPLPPGCAAPPAPSSAGLIEAARKGLEALEECCARFPAFGEWKHSGINAAIAALRAALGKEEAK